MVATRLKWLIMMENPSTANFISRFVVLFIELTLSHFRNAVMSSLIPDCIKRLLIAADLARDKLAANTSLI